MAYLNAEEGTSSGTPVNAETLFALGMMQASGRDAPVDLVAAHKWFNIAASRGHQEAASLRREIAVQMSDSEIGQAQRAARDWLKENPVVDNPVMMAPVIEIRAAA